MSDTDKLKEHLDEIDKGAKIERARTTEEHRNKLDAREERIMDYFWNRERQRERRNLSVLVIDFFERDREEPGGEDIIDGYTNRALTSLLAKEYLRIDKSLNRLEPDVAGGRWLERRHPKVIRWWQKLIEQMPPLLQILVTVVGFLGSIYGVIELVRWVFGKK